MPIRGSADIEAMRPWDFVRLRSSPRSRARRRYDVASIARDRITGLCDLEALEAAAEWNCREASRGGDPVVLFAIGVPGIGSVRERLGERDASRMVIDASRLLATVAGDDGLAARVGGERFEVLLAAAGSGTEARFAESVQRQADRFNHWGARPYVLTFSIGAARSDRDHRLGLDELRERARDRQVPDRRRARTAERLGA
jgi:GGDEF domain-containing protein